MITIFTHKKYALALLAVFSVMMGLLFFSYIHKLGFLGIAENILFYSAPLAALLVVIFIPDGFYARLFWLMMFLIFIFVLLDKIFRLHMVFAVAIAPYVPIHPVVVINLLYIATFLVSLAFFAPYLIQQFSTNRDWIILFGIGLLLKVAAIGADVIYHDITEDYLELFSIYFFTGALFHVLTRKST